MNIISANYLIHLFIVNCVWASWSSWSTCSITCGTGTQSRSRRIQSLQQNGGTCTGDVMETRQEDCGACPAGMCDASKAIQNKFLQPKSLAHIIYPNKLSSKS